MRRQNFFDNSNINVDGPLGNCPDYSLPLPLSFSSSEQIASRILSMQPSSRHRIASAVHSDVSDKFRMNKRTYICVCVYVCMYPTRRRGECRISGFSVNSIAFARPKPEAGFTVFLVACVSTRLPNIGTRYPASILYPREEKWCAIRSLRSRGRRTLEIFIRLPRG